MDPLISSPLPWLYDISSAYREVPVYKASKKTQVSFFARSMEISEVTSDCITDNVCSPTSKDYRFVTLRLRVWDIIPFVGQGCVLLDVSLSIKRRTSPTDTGNFQSPTKSIANLNALVALFRTGGELVGPTRFTTANFDLPC